MPSTSGRIDRRNRLSNRQINKLASSPGWIAAAEQLLTTPNDMRTRGRRQTILLTNSPGWTSTATAKERSRSRLSQLPTIAYSPPKTRRHSMLPQPVMPSTKVNDGSDLENENKKTAPIPKSHSRSKLPVKSSSAGSEDKKIVNAVSSEKTSEKTSKSITIPLKSSNTKKTEKKSSRSKKSGEENTIPKTRKEKAESRGSRRRNMRLRPFSKKEVKRKETGDESDSESASMDISLPEDEDQRTKKRGKEEKGKQNLLRSSVVRISRVPEKSSGSPLVKASMPTIEEDAKMLEQSATDESLNGTSLDDSKARCLIL